MLRAAVLAAAVASASAFAPAAFAPMKARTAAVKSLKMQSGDFSAAVPFLKRPSNLDGSYVGDVGFDPLGFSDVFDLRVLREAELKHGRFAMLAVLGFIVQELYTFPFFPKMAPVDAHDYFVQQGGGSQIIFWISFVEIFGVVALFETLQGKREPGDFAFDPLGLAKDEATLERYRLAEIKHSRLAMIAIGGFIHQYWVTKQTVLEQLGNFKSLQ
ncbi:light-harvesting Chl a protein 10 [Guillardia theta CCMP2712]|uniref:Light-harvesting Chl a protein 10 n=1 Tax=Guillardia theta (strain CCMP2712) TaxID=905079 RepID=L1IUF6_GUITC|nr:light-harvesting Chl a protein 10 [Guillardia theta CCMP2712]EKX39534.1 light-harvesting Chl a protein 10 [Guillardia theta CCMP2712]|eukprot:XP_005826514.1 light-harvesting Chl a protein 10 [Guillardia theta CCMP2712]